LTSCRMDAGEGDYIGNILVIATQVEECFSGPDLLDCSRTRIVGTCICSIYGVEMGNPMDK
jgi:hypothetical protein